MTDTTRESELPVARRRVMFVVATLLPVFFFVLLEVALRLAGYGGVEPLFEPVRGQAEYLKPNERVIHRFFASPSRAPAVSIDTTYFRKNRSEDTLRVVVQGGSTAAGFPYGKFASPAGMLQQRLKRSFPNREVEVITTAMSAVNSYTLLDFVDEILELQPDAVVIYAGHNEYLGVLGVGSTYTASRSRKLTRLIMRLQRLRVYQLVQNLLTGDDDDSGSRQPQTGTLMARIAGERSIPRESELYAAGIAQFRGNMSELLGAYADAGVPVFIGTLVCNEKDQPPFAGGPADDVDGAAWQTEFIRAGNALDSGDVAAADTAITRLLELDAESANARFLNARLLHARGQYDAARDEFLAAKDRDRLRFRASEEVNAVIRDLATEYAATLVDTQSAFRQSSPNGVVGDELMLEHLHPNSNGYFILADALYDSMRTTNVFGEWTRVIDDRTARAEIPLTEVETLAGGYRVARLKGDWPFTETKSVPPLPAPTDEIEHIAQTWFTGQISWADAMNRALVHYQRTGRTGEAVRVAANLADAFPFNDNPQYVTGQLLMRAGKPDVALGYLHRAATLAPSSVQNLIALAQAFDANNFRDRALDTLARALEIEPANETARQLRTQWQRNGTTGND